MKMTPILTSEIHHEHDIVSARRRAMQIAAMLGFEEQDQTRVATAVSEIARNSFRYAGGGKAEFLADLESTPQKLVVRVTDRGHGIADIKRVLSGKYESKTGLGMGLIGARRLMDGFDIQSSQSGTTVTLDKLFPKNVKPLAEKDVLRISQEFARQEPEDLVDELERRNHELLRTLEELQKRQEELNRLNTELEDTNRGVVALYAELDERAQQLKNSVETKTRFLSHLGHELRTPLNSVVALSRLLLERADGPLTEEQEKQVEFIRKSGESLFELVNDLLDLAKAEAGKLPLRPGEIEIPMLFSTLRGMLKPLSRGPSVNFIFEDPAGVPVIRTDESKLAQILRNLISNALKYTEKGEVRVSAALAGSGDAVLFTVKDTGIGIAPENLDRIFEEFVQIENPLQRRTKGTGLGLPLSRKLAELLGGGISVSSQLGVGSTFTLTIPLTFPQEKKQEGAGVAELSSEKLLVIDDEEISRYLVRQALGAGGFVLLEATEGEEGIERARAERPGAIFLDLRMPGMSGFEVLSRLKADPQTRNIPVIIVTSKSLPEAERAMLEMNSVAILSKEIFASGSAGEGLRIALKSAGVALVSSSGLNDTKGGALRQ